MRLSTFTEKKGFDQEQKLRDSVKIGKKIAERVTFHGFLWLIMLN